MKLNLGSNSPLNLLKHFAIIAAIGSILLLFFFYIYLPSTTNHGESITVPDLEGIALDDLEQVLIRRSLRYEIADSTYSEQYPARAVLRQFPKSGATVKEGRKIYLTINRSTAPTIGVPDLSGSVLNAEAVLASYELKMGKIHYVPFPDHNWVIEMRYQGETLQVGDTVPKGSEIDLLVGNGRGGGGSPMEDLVGYPLDDAKYYITAARYRLGVVLNQADTIDENWVVERHVPAAGNTIRLGQAVDLWVIHKDSVNNNQPQAELLDGEENDNN